MSRGGFKISRSDYSEIDRGDKVDWLEDFAKNLEAKNNQPPKSAVEAARQRNDQSFYDQISSIVGNKPATNSVEGIVQQMQERTGLREYLRRQSEKQIKNTKVAQEVSNDVFGHLGPKLKETILALIKNKAKTSHGLTAVPAIQHEILSIFQNQGVQPQDINTPEVAKVISDLLLEETGQNPVNTVDNNNLGRGVGVMDVEDDDHSNSDFFKGLLPAKST